MIKEKIDLNTFEIIPSDFFDETVAHKKNNRLHKRLFALFLQHIFTILILNENNYKYFKNCETMMRESNVEMLRN